MALEALVGFADRLQRLRVAAGGPSLTRLAELTAALGRPLARSTISDKLTAKSLPEWDFVVWFVHGCVAHAREAGVPVPADLADLAGWDAAHWRLLRTLDDARSGQRLASAARTEIARRTEPPPASEPAPDVDAPPRQLPAPPRHFVGRAAELAALTALADEAERSVVVAAVDGMAGVGKSALVLRWAHRAADRFPDGQLYVDLRGFGPTGTPVPPAEALRGLLDALGVPARRLPAGLDARAGLYRDALAGRRMLVVLDNARDAEQVRPLLPGSPGCLVLVTSRSRRPGLAVDGAHRLTLDPLTASEAREVLAGRIGRDRLAAEPGAAEDLVAACAGLPLALSLVAARARPDAPLADLRAGRWGTGVWADLRAAFSWSYRRLDPAAALFRVLGGHPGPDIGAPAAASLAGLAPEKAGPLLAELVAAHLVEEAAPGRYAVHPLLRVYAAELLDTVDGEAGRARQRMLDHYLRSAHAADRMLDPHRDAIAPPEPQAGVTPESFADRPAALAWFAAERPALLAVVTLAATAGDDAYARDLAWSLTTYLDRCGHWDDWAASQRVALEAATRLGDPVGQARAHRDLARAHARLDDYDRAQAHLRSALDLYEGCGDLAGQAHSHLVIGRVSQRQGRLPDALAHTRRALDLFRMVGYRHGQADALRTLADLQGVSAATPAAAGR